MTSYNGSERLPNRIFVILIFFSIILYLSDGADCTILVMCISCAAVYICFPEIKNSWNLLVVPLSDSNYCFSINIYYLTLKPNVTVNQKLETTQRWTLLTSYGIYQTQTLSLICQQKTQKSNLWKFRCRSSISIKQANISVISNYEKIKRQCCYLGNKKFTHHLIENPITCSNSHFWTPQFPSFTFHLSVYMCLFFFTHSQFPFFQGLCRKSHTKNWHQ